MRRKVDAAVENGVGIPKKGGGWTQRYICPSGLNLQFDPDSPDRHFCPSDGKHYEGESLDAAWRSIVHTDNIETARNAALMHRLTGEAKYADFAIEILKRYAMQYKSMPPHGGPAGFGRIMGQSLGEARWLIVACEAFDMIRGYEGFAERDQGGIADKLLMAAANHLKNYPFGIHNIQVWQSTAMLMAGILAGSDSMRDRALADLRDQIDQGISDEGIWHETSIGYHLFAMRPFGILGSICRRHGLDVCDSEKLKNYFASLLQFAMPDGKLPALNDGRPENWATHLIGGIVAARYIYDDDSNGALLQALLKKAGGRVDDFHIFLCYVQPQRGAEAPLPEYRSKYLPDSGLTVLRKDGKYALLKHNDPWPSHEHFDRLGVIYYDGARELFPDRGTGSYAHSLYRSWQQKTESHNTFMVDGLEQSLEGCESSQFFETADVDGIAVRCNRLYKGVSAARTLAIFDGGLADVTVLNSSEAHTYDWFLSANAPLFDLRGDPMGESPNPEISLLKREALEDGAISIIEWAASKQSEKSSQTFLFSPGSSILFRGEETAYAQNEKAPMLMWRQQETRAAFIALTVDSGTKADIRVENGAALFSVNGVQFSIDLQTNELAAQ